MEGVFVLQVTMVADLCHFVFSFICGEGEKTKAKRRKNASFRLFDFATNLRFSTSPRNNEKAQIWAFRLRHEITKRRKFESFRYFVAKSERRKYAAFRYFIAKSKRRKNAILRVFAFIFSPLPRDNEMTKLHKSATILVRVVMKFIVYLY